MTDSVLKTTLIAGDTEVQVEDLGRAAYGPTFECQLERQREVIASRGSSMRPTMHVLLVEHDPPVITISRRREAASHLVATASQLAAAGVEVAETNRGGDITYHGPGQLVAYPIIDLNIYRFRLHSYMRFLEQIVIDTLAEWGLEGGRDDSATGVWIEPGAAGGGRKIAAMGVRVSRWVSMHGLALNVSTNLRHFDLIVPCGLAGRRVTTMEAELNGAAPAMADVKRALLGAIEHRLADRRAEVGAPDA